MGELQRPRASGETSAPKSRALTNKAAGRRFFDPSRALAARR
jgi:hypothetical protein